MMEVSTKMSRKPWPETAMMQKLMTEDEVFNVFVAGNPLDGLYPHIKRYNFIWQFKEKEGFVRIMIQWYIKHIQRAKKKWFFIQIEDISWNIEFFVREILNFQKFDILIITWFKGRSLSMEKIVKVSREQLIKQAWWRYNPEMTVVKAKALRMKSLEDDTEKEHEDENIENENEETENIQPRQTVFTLPDSIKKIDEIMTIIQTERGENTITIGNHNVWLSEEWLQKIQNLFAK